MKSGKKDNNPMFFIFLLISAICIGTSIYTGILISKAESTAGGMVLLQDSGLWSLTLVLMVSLISVVLCGFASIKVYLGKAAQAHKANEDKIRFFSRISRDMREPVSAIIYLCQKAYNSGSLGDIKACIEAINTSGIHILGMVDDVFDLGCIESGMLELEHRIFNPGTEADRLANEIMPDIKKNCQSFTLQIDPDLPEYLACDSYHLNQVLLRLLRNAVRFTPQGGRIELSATIAEQDDRRIKLAWHVRDSGVGIDKATASTIFSPFDAQGDAGLGLAVAWRLVEAMGGNLAVKSEMGRGSDFYFSIWADISCHEEYTAANNPDIPCEISSLTGEDARALPPML